MRERLVAYLPRYGSWAARLGWALNLRDRLPGLAALSEWLLGFTSKRSLPRWRSDFFREDVTSPAPSNSGVPIPAKRECVLLVDTFNRYFEPENARAALAVLQAAGHTVHLPKATDGNRPLCCGRTFLAAGLVDEARLEARRMIDAFKPYVERGVPVVGLEPSCLLGLRDEFLSLLPGVESAELALNAFLFEEFLAREHAAGRFELTLRPLREKKAYLHGHCHQKAFAAMSDVERALKLVPGLQVETIESSCCGMAGSFGYEAAHYDVSMKMGELSLLPRVRRAAADELIVADGVSCRHQIRDGSGREAIHAVRLLQRALA